MADLTSRLSLQPVAEDDFEAMLALHTDAMKPSLERVGRFSHQGSRERLAADFAVQHMHHIVFDGDKRIGFISLKPEGSDALRLDHLYLRTGCQGLGIGEWALNWVKAQARAQGKDVLVTTLTESDSNRFYQRHGFEKIGADDVDVHYRWRVSAEDAC